ncbi:hypothetical protein ISG33_10310 [Glaciecola sp. MH2013]|uniref:hypothetical protein n=1 Tax=Glaciecola sp. MH2013 TaxID=2785524 RepID=UPI00189CBE5E|nr:hypothetical protein [Glaciecola sp. MH2013]MBF7073790.1 hypothetical protein [Glaciecola sp. MH2013]
MIINKYKSQQGLSLVSVLIASSISLILGAIGGPALVGSMEQARIKGVSEEVYFFVREARSQAIASSTNIDMDVKVGIYWCLGLSDQGNCDCNTANSCKVNDLEKTISYTDYPSIVLTDVDLGGDFKAQFDGERGLALNDSGSMKFSSPTLAMRVSLNSLGRTQLCSENGQIGSYQSC